MKKLFLFARRFPYGMNEPYLETEIKYYSSFDEVHIFSLSVEKDAARRDVFEANNIFYHTVQYQNLFKYIFALLASLFTASLYKELYKLIKTKRLALDSMKKLVIYLSKTKVEKNEIKKIISNKNLVSADDEIILYTYRFDYASYLISKMDFNCKEVKRVVRGHRIDLFEYVHSSNYLPFREFILDNIDQLILISKENMEYAIERYPKYTEKFVLSYLGTNDLPFRETPLTPPLQLVSISSVTPVKRVEFILESIVKASEKLEIHWSHYGEGPEFEGLQKLVEQQKDNRNLKVSLEGHVDNKVMLDALINQDFHVFINLSTSEGLPVSIMEAMSVGIPVIATNAGGTYEIVVDDYTGSLVEVNVSAEEVAQRIEKISAMDAKEYSKLRNNARKHWEENFSADRNYQKYVNDLLVLLD